MQPNKCDHLLFLVIIQVKDPPWYKTPCRCGSGIFYPYKDEGPRRQVLQGRVTLREKDVTLRKKRVKRD